MATAKKIAKKVSVVKAKTPTKKVIPKKKTSKEEHLDSYISELNRRIWNVQEEMLEQGITVISYWLSSADNVGLFNECVDWLFGSEGDKWFKSSSGTVAFDAVGYAIYQCQNSMENQDDEDEDEDEGGEDAPSNFYDNVREFFNV